MLSKLKCLLVPTPQANCVSAALFLVRIVMGIAFMYHGWGKIQNPFAWMPPESPVPGFLQFLAALSEFGGGIALVVGLLTRVASLGLACTMLVATYFHAVVLGDPFVASGPGQGAYELALLYFTLSVLFMATGPGRFSLDAKLIKAS